MAGGEMTVDGRRRYPEKVLPPYVAADRAGEGDPLGRMGAVTGMAGKGLIRLLRTQQPERKRRTEARGRSYGPDVERAVGVVWCGKRRITCAWGASSRS